MRMQQGTSLAEMLVALVSSSVLILTLMNQYLGVKRHYQRVEHGLETAMDVQLVYDLMRDSIRQAGFTPCIGVDYLTSIDTRNRRQGLASIEMQSEDGAGFQISHMNTRYGLLTSQLSQTSWIAKHDMSYLRHASVLISDCYHAEVHTIDDIRLVNGHSEITLGQPMVYDYVPPIYIGEWLEEGFFVRQGALFYSLRHVGKLSQAINDGSVSLSQHNGKRFVHIELALEKREKTIQLDTMLRNA